MSTWDEDKKWSDRFLPVIKQVLGFYLIGEPPVEEDQERNTDLIVLKMNTVRVACRIRRFKYFQHYPNEFTIRTSRPSGNKTELTKIIEGWGDYLFYGFCDHQEQNIYSYFLGDLSVFRSWFASSTVLLNNGQTPGLDKRNFDNSSAFKTFNVNSLPPEFIKGRYIPNFL